jgi:predicted lysophospholipase L1 biosynthesis ABC-type transport system permease subunit
VLAVLGVLNSVLMATRERVHDLGVYKALGMTPRQTITMVICWVIAPAIAAIIALPVREIAQDVLMRTWPPTRRAWCCRAASSTSWASPTSSCWPWPG